MAHIDAKIIVDFMNYARNLRADEFIKNMLLCFAAPTISGIKAACLINFRRHAHEDMRSLWLEHSDEWLRDLRLQSVLLNEHSRNMNALVLVYRLELLAEALRCEQACSLLAEYGYPVEDAEACVECLRKKFCSGFPHEIGVFLSYPPEDVRGFIENRKPECSECFCCWKVYSNPERAREISLMYKRAECEAARLLLAGKVNYK